MANRLFYEKPFKTARAFAKCLNPLGDFWRKRGPMSDWVFRGHEDAGWDLVPAAMRPHVLKNHLRIVDEWAIVGEPSQRNLEADAVAKFVDKLSATGLPIPEDSQWLRSFDALKGLFGEEIFPLPILRSLYALAQHHGIPTRLLDWSREPLIAAYFSCWRPARYVSVRERSRRRAARRLRKEQGLSLIEAHKRVRRGHTRLKKKIAVWALKEQALRFVMEDCWGKRIDRPLLKRLDAPPESNPNLRAQRGLFTLLEYRGAEPPTGAGQWSLVSLIHELEKERMPEGSSERVHGPLLVKFTLPHEETPALLYLLSECGVDASTVYRNYDGAVRALREARYHRDLFV